MSTLSEEQTKITTKYEICGILKIEKAIDATEMQQGEGGCSGCHRADKDRVRLQNGTIFFTFLSSFSHGISFASHLGY